MSTGLAASKNKIKSRADAANVTSDPDIQKTSIHLNKQIFRTIKLHAVRKETTTSALIEQALREFIDNHKISD